MSDNKITSDGIVKIAEAITLLNVTLRKLDISHNGISDDGTGAISECLKINNTLIELDISWNEITSNENC